MARGMTIAMTSAEMGALPAGNRLRRQKAFAAARRHTRLVLILRKAIPLGVAVSLAGLVAMPFLRPVAGVSSVSLQSVGIADGKIKMETPRLSGYRKDNKPYQMTADTALQDIRNPTQIELRGLVARIQMESEGWADIRARTGHFDTQAEKLRLVDDVSIRTETGYDMAMRTADIDFKAGSVRSRDPVTVNLGATTISAETFDVKDNGALISFQTRVRVVIANAPARTIAGPEREGSTPMPELLQAAPGPDASQGAKQ